MKKDPTLAYTIFGHAQLGHVRKKPTHRARRAAIHQIAQGERKRPGKVRAPKWYSSLGLGPAFDKKVRP